MKVNNNSNLASQVQSSRKKDMARDPVEDLKNKSSPSLESLKDSAKVEMSDRAQMMSKAKQIASAPDETNSAKIERLQKMIDSGSYKVDAASIADRLVDEHLLMPE